MYIPYESIANILRIFKNQRLESYLYDKKVKQNLNFIASNKPKVLKKLNNKLKNGQKINVVFYCYDETKWKCQSVYDIFSSDSHFDVKILVTKSAAKNKDNPTYQSIKDVKKTYDYFKQKGLSVEYAYDIKKNRYIPFKNFNPDIIFYQHPWYVERTQGPVVCSKFAFTCYVPYYFPFEVGDIDNKIDYYLRFHKYIERYYALDKTVENKLKQKMDNHGVNVKAVGYPNFDYFYKNKKQGDSIIYAPHWSVGGLGQYSAFDWSGKFMLEYAQNHPENRWIFRPHPILYKSLIDSKLMTENEAKKYYDDWEKLGVISTSGDYFDLFDDSKMMITDSCTFLAEYFVTEKPLIILMSDNSSFKSLEHPILETYYCAKNQEELVNLIDTVSQNDYMKPKRLHKLESLEYFKSNASENIYNDIMNIMSEGNYG